MPLRTINTADRVLQAIQDNVAAAVDPLTRNPLRDCNLVTVFVSNSGDNTVNHGLARPAQGWILVKTNAYVDLKESATANNVKEKQLLLNANAAATITLLVF